MKPSQVTTKDGDLGQTRALSGDLLAKDDPIIECGGWLDAARAHLALLYTQLEAARPEEHDLLGDLWWLLHCCFLIGSAVNDPEVKHPEYRFGNIGPNQLRRLEDAQARIEEGLTLPHAFIAAASNPLAAQADVAATTVRTLERRIVALAHACPGFDASAIVPFVNRLGDYCYIVARHLDGGVYRAVDYEQLL